jgi:hypothetical protein
MLSCILLVGCKRAVPSVPIMNVCESIWERQLHTGMRRGASGRLLVSAQKTALKGKPVSYSISQTCTLLLCNYASCNGASADISGPQLPWARWWLRSSDERHDLCWQINVMLLLPSQERAVRVPGPTATTCRRGPARWCKRRSKMSRCNPHSCHGYLDRCGDVGGL